MTPDLTQIDREKWHQWQSFEAEGNPGFFRTIVQAFVDSTPSTLESLVAMTKKQDAIKARTFAHSLRSSCEVVGAMNLSLHFHQVELDLKQESRFPTLDDLKNAERALDQILVELQPFL